MSGLSSHVLDTALGAPARGLALQLEVLGDDGVFAPIVAATTDADGRVRDLLAGAPLAARTYRLTFETGAYFAGSGRPVFYPQVVVAFTVAAPGEHHHIPLLLSPFGYSTYRGS
jgi:5-hydroxyisourate hydrolase